MRRGRPFSKGNILIGMGVLLILAASLFTLRNVLEANAAEEASAEVLAEMTAEMENAAESAGRTATDSEEEIQEPENDVPEMPTIEIDGNRYIGYLTVPSIDLTLPIMEEWDYDRLRIAPCRYYGSTYDKNLVIAGHNYRKHFSPLRWQDLGTEIDFVDADENLTRYEITQIDTIDPTQIDEMIAESEDWDLTLFTCTLDGRARYTVRCKIIEE